METSTIIAIIILLFMIGGGIALVVSLSGPDETSIVTDDEYLVESTGDSTGDSTSTADSTGSEADEDDTGCGIGEILNDAGVCEACGSGTVPNADRTECEQCPYNWNYIADGACQTCPYGTVLNDAKNGCKCEDASKILRRRKDEYSAGLRLEEELVCIDGYNPPDLQHNINDATRLQSDEPDTYLTGCNYSGSTYKCIDGNTFCPYQMPGNFRWHHVKDSPDGEVIKCIPPEDGTQGNGTDLIMGPQYYIKGGFTYEPSHELDDVFVANGQRLEGCVNGIDNDTYKCKNPGVNDSVCPYQLFENSNEGNWRWQLSDDGSKCVPPVNGALNYDGTLGMQAKYHFDHSKTPNAENCEGWECDMLGQKCTLGTPGAWVEDGKEYVCRKADDGTKKWVVDE